MTMAILKMFEPIILPMAMSSSPLRAPAMAVASSGRLVPMAITVRPMVSSPHGEIIRQYRRVIHDHPCCHGHNDQRDTQPEQCNRQRTFTR